MLDNSHCMFQSNARHPLGNLRSDLAIKEPCTVYLLDLQVSFRNIRRSDAHQLASRYQPPSVPTSVMALLFCSSETLASSLTPAVLCTLLLRWWHTTQRQMIIDLTACMLCLALYPMKQPQLPLALAVAYTVWTHLSISYEASGLPSHSTFMRNLVFVKQGRKPDDCIVCWDHEHRLAQLFCGHRCCDRCLQLLGEDSQTTCPLCRRSLFSVDNGLFCDRVEAAAWKGMVVCLALPTALHFLAGLHDVQRAQAPEALLSFVCALLYGFFLLTMAGSIWRYGAKSYMGPHDAEVDARVVMATVTSALFVSHAVVLYQTWFKSIFS